jgi:hypothetical protein
MKDTLDSDIAAMTLSEGEKWGLQVYRNYSHAFGEHRVKQFVEQSSPFEEDVLQFEQVAKLLVSEDPRVIPVVASSYADEQLEDMFRREIPDTVPGGRSALLSGFGPLARLSQRLQMAFAFGWLSKDLLIELDHLRKIRNDLSHKWDPTLLGKRLDELIENKQSPIEEHLGDGIRFPQGFHQSLQPMQRFRVRVIWTLGRLTYEARLWVPAAKADINPVQALYGPSPPAMLRGIAAVSVTFSQAVVGA